MRNPHESGRSRKRRRGQDTADTWQLAPLETVLQELGVRECDWDLCILGDGSGSNWQQGCGWAATLIDKYARSRKLFYGAMSSGTVNVSELVPYLHALLWYESNPGPQLRKRLHRGLHVQLITDSQLTANQGNELVERSTNLPLWAAMSAFRDSGYSLCWHWVKRSRLGLNQLADELSRQARQKLEQVVPPSQDMLRAQNPSYFPAKE